MELPSIWIDVGFIEYFDSKYNQQLQHIEKQQKNKLSAANLPKNKGVPHLDPSSTSDASGDLAINHRTHPPTKTKSKSKRKRSKNNIEQNKHASKLEKIHLYFL